MVHEIYACVYRLKQDDMIAGFGESTFPFLLVVRCKQQLLLYLLTDLSPSPEAANCEAIQEIPSNFKEPEGSSLCSQEPSTRPYPEPVWSSPHHSHPISPRSILILSTHLLLGLHSGLFPSGFPTIILYAFLVSPILATCPAISYSLTWSF
jgi:hypothetical protein